MLYTHTLKLESVHLLACLYILIFLQTHNTSLIFNLLIICFFLHETFKIDSNSDNLDFNFFILQYNNYVFVKKQIQQILDHNSFEIINIIR